MNRLPLIVSAAAALLLSSCLESQIGKCIREGAEFHTGVDILHPVDGKVYQTPEEQRNFRRKGYILAREVRYRHDNDLFHFRGLVGMAEDEVSLSPPA